MGTINSIGDDPGIRVIAQAMAARLIHDVQRERGVGIDVAVKLAVERIGREIDDEEMRRLVQGQARLIEELVASVGTW